MAGSASTGKGNGAAQVETGRKNEKRDNCRRPPFLSLPLVLTEAQGKKQEKPRLCWTDTDVTSGDWQAQLSHEALAAWPLVAVEHWEKMTNSFKLKTATPRFKTQWDLLDLTSTIE